MSEDNGMPDTSEYKAKLDEMANRAKNPPKEEEKSATLVEKVSEYIPAVGRMLGSGEKPEQDATQAGNKIPGPPHRPIHDKQIEQFIKDQHHSKKVIEIEEESTQD